MRDAKRRIFCDKNNEIMSHYQFLACVIQKKIPLAVNIANGIFPFLRK